jgi:ABC-2 type transport system permease protein
MIRRIATKEILDLSRDGRLRWSAALVLVLLAASLTAGWRQYRDVRAQHEQAQQAMRAQWLAQGPKNAHSAAHYGIYAFKPKLPLSFVDSGLDAYTGVAVWLEAHKQDEFRFRPAQDATAVGRFGELTAAAVLELLIPLLIILLTFSSIAGEREQGTLRQLLSLGVDRRALAAGKAAGVAAVLAALLVPAAIVGAAAMVLGSGVADVSASAGRIATMAATYVLYFGTFVALGLGASAWGRTARAALLALLAFWIVGTLVAPRAVAELARRVYPTPSAMEFATRVEHDMELGADGRTPRASRDAAYRAQVLRQYGVDRIDALPVSFVGLLLQQGEEYGNTVFDRHYGDLWTTFRRQRVVHEIGSLISPYPAIRSISMGLAGTDFDQHQHFATAAEGYRRTLVKAMNMEVANRAGQAGRGYISGPDVWAALPPFSYESPGLAWVFRNQWVSLAVLAVWCASAWILAFGAMRRTAVA